MSAQKKNKLSAAFDGREKNTSVVQRFVTEEERPPENISETSAEISAEPEVKPKYYLQNAIEDAVIDEVAAALKHMRDVCKCEKCFYDICAVALNSFPPHYATTEQGELLTKVNTLLNAETRTKLTTAVFNAIDIVSKNPLHNAPVYNVPVQIIPVESRRIGAIVSKS